MKIKTKSDFITGLYEFIGANVQRIRLAKGWTQDDLADKIGMIRTSIANLEGGRQRPPIHKVYDMALALEVSVMDLLPTMEQIDALKHQKPLPFDHSKFSEDELKWIYERIQGGAGE